MKATCRSCGESRSLSQEAITSPDFDFTCPHCQRIMVLEHDSTEGLVLEDSERRDAPTKVDSEPDAPADFDAYAYAARQLGVLADDDETTAEDEHASARLVAGIPTAAPPVPSWDGGDTQQVRELARNTPELPAADPAPEAVEEPPEGPEGVFAADGDAGEAAVQIEGETVEGETDDGAGEPAREDPLADMEVVVASITAGTGSRTFDRPAIEPPEPPRSGSWKVPRSEAGPAPSPDSPRKSGAWKIEAGPPVSEAPKSGSWKLAPTSDGPRTASSKRTVSATPAPAPAPPVPPAKKITEEIPIPKIEEEDADLAEPPKIAASPARTAHDSDWYDLLDEVLTEAPPTPAPTTGAAPAAAEPERRKIEIKEGMSAADAELVRELRAKLESQGDPAAELLQTRPIRRSTADIPTPATSLPSPRPSDKAKNAQTQKVSELPDTTREPPPPPRSGARPAAPPTEATPVSRPRPQSARPSAVAKKTQPPRPANAQTEPLRSKKIVPRPAAESQRMRRSGDDATDDDTRNSFQDAGKGSDVPTTRESAPAPAPRRREPKGPREVDARGGQVQAFQRENLDPSFVTAREPASDAAERFRELFHAVFPHRKDAPQVVVVTSAVGGEGRTTVAVNLAVAAASTPGRGALLVSADTTGRPLLSYFGLDTRPPGLLEALEGSKDPRQLVMRFALGMLYVLPLGQGGELAGSLLAGDAMGALLGKLRRLCPPAMAIIVDGPSLEGEVAPSLARLADGCVLVVRPGETSVRVVQRARERLGTARLLGTVLNEVPRHALGPRSAERAGLNDLREGIEQALDSIDATVAEVGSLREANEQAREAQEDVFRAALANFQQGLAALENKLGRAFRDELKRVRQGLVAATGAAAQNPAAKAQVGAELEKLKRAFQQLEEQKKAVAQSQEALAKEKAELVTTRRALEAELERQARGQPPSGQGAPGEGELVAIQRALEEVRAMALSERARAHDAEDQVKRLTARVQELVGRESKLRSRLGVAAAAEAAGVPPPEGEPPVMKMAQRPTDPLAAVRPEYRSAPRPTDSQRFARGAEPRPSDSQRFSRAPSSPQPVNESQRFIRPTPESQRVSRLSSERVRSLADEPVPDAPYRPHPPGPNGGPNGAPNGSGPNGDLRHDTRANPRPGASR